MARSSAERRLIRLLADENYGPKLARLRGQDERYILRLIDQNKGKEARREINRLDEERRARVRTQRQERKRKSATREVKGISSRKQREQQAIANILRRFNGRANRSRVVKNVAYMSSDELDFAISASASDLSSRAIRPPYRTTRKGEDLNPFWYH